MNPRRARRFPRSALTGLFLVVLALAPHPSWSQSDDSPNDISSPSEEVAPSTSANETSPNVSRVEVPAPSDLAVRFYRTGNAWWIFNLLWSFVVPLVILGSGLSVRLRDLAKRWTGGSWYLVVLVYFGLYLTLVSVIDLPFAYLLGFARPHAYGLSNQLLSKWIVDMLKGFGIGLLAAALFLWIPYLLLRRSPRRWWFYTSLAAIPLFLFVLLVTPLWIAPLFNDFGPMQDKALERRILDLAERSQVSAERVFEVDKSVDTKAVNAYVTGFAGSKRIVLWDTLLDRLSDDEVLFVMGHELGHYVLGHVRESILISSLGVFVLLFCLHRASEFVFRRWGNRLQIHSLADPAALPLIIILLNLGGLVASPASLAYSRWHEHEADRFALELTQDNAHGAQAFVALQTSNLSFPYPGPVFELFRSSHPPIGRRVEFCNEYRPWESGVKLRYGDRFLP
ncbi:MAG: M48 family metallopeptidase [Thermoanaerobaculia bacterium]|nr:M48 family metallopeptidase [Thermoanaerobaculia bacterium]